MNELPRYTQDWFGQAFLACRPKLRAFIRSGIFSAEDADDILQDVAAIAWEKIEKLRTPEEFQPWLFGIAKNKVLKYCSKQTNRKQLSLSPEALEAIWSEHAISGDASQESLLSELRVCLSKLPEEHQKLLLERHQPRVTNREIAETNGFSESKVSRLLNRLYGSLMKCIHNLRENLE